MTILLDAGVLIAFASTQDSLHARARSIIRRIRRGTYGGAWTTDHALAEALTFLQRRVGRPEAIRPLLTMIEDPAAWCRPLPTDARTFEAAVRLHVDQYARRLSVADCVQIVHAMRMQSPIATFDGGFTGLVPTITE